MFPADKHLTARQYPSLRAENRLDPRFEFVVFQRQTDGFRRDDMVIVIIINISMTITTRGGYDLRIVLKENIAPESNIALNPQFLKELFLFDVKLSLHCDFCTVIFLLQTFPASAA